MPEYYNNHVITSSMTIDVGATDGSPSRMALSGMAAELRRVLVFADSAPGDAVRVRLTDGQQQVIPLSGWLTLPVGGSVLELTAERRLPGPPWTVIVEAYGAAVPLVVALEMADYRETDAEMQELAILRAIYNELYQQTHPGKAGTNRR